jgi:glycine oxidase
MLAPVTEAVPAEREALALGTASLRRWPDFAAELATAGADPGLQTRGTLAVALDPGDRAELDRLAEQLSGMGRQVEALSGREARRAEPSLGVQVRRALSVPGDLSVDNRALLDALLTACRRAGVEFDGQRCTALPAADVVVLAAGAHSARLHPALARVIRPVKGEILRLRSRPGTLPPPSRTVRAIVSGRHSYLVPRNGGLRPGTPDNLPVIGELEPGVLAATGHHRNGILLAPLTADAVLALLRGEAVPVEAGPATPARLPPEQLVSANRCYSTDSHSRGSRSAP